MNKNKSKVFLTLMSIALLFALGIINLRQKSWIKDLYKENASIKREIELEKYVLLKDISILKRKTSRATIEKRAKEILGMSIPKKKNIEMVRKEIYDPTVGHIFRKVKKNIERLM